MEKGGHKKNIIIWGKVSSVGGWGKTQTFSEICKSLFYGIFDHYIRLKVQNYQ